MQDAQTAVRESKKPANLTLLAAPSRQISNDYKRREKRVTSEAKMCVKLALFAMLAL
jgi:hypothetical protein